MFTTIPLQALLQLHPVSFWYVVSPFSIVSNYLLISFSISSLIHWLFRSELISIYPCTSPISVTHVSSNSTVVRHTLYGFNPLNLPRLTLWLSLWSVLNASRALEENVCSAPVKWSVLQKSVRKSWLEYCLSLLSFIFCLSVLSIIESGELSPKLLLNHLFLPLALWVFAPCILWFWC